MALYQPIGSTLVTRSGRDRCTCSVERGRHPDEWCLVNLGQRATNHHQGSSGKGPGTFAEILMFYAHRTTSGSRQSGLFTASRRNAGFLIRGDDELKALQGFSVPEPGIKIEDTSCFRSEIWIPGKDPTPMLPRTKSIGTQPTPEGRSADLGDDTLGHHLLPDVGKRQPRERQPEAMRELTGESFYLHHDAGGKRGRDARREAVRQDPVAGPVRIACATCSRSGAVYPSVQR